MIIRSTNRKKFTTIRTHLEPKPIEKQAKPVAKRSKNIERKKIGGHVLSRFSSFFFFRFIFCFFFLKFHSRANESLTAYPTRHLLLNSFKMATQAELDELAELGTFFFNHFFLQLPSCCIVVNFFKKP